VRKAPAKFITKPLYQSDFPRGSEADSYGSCNGYANYAKVNDNAIHVQYRVGALSVLEEALR
jgi:hypothetical protein